MRWTLRARLVFASAALLSAVTGCDTPQATIDEVACTNICRCFVTTPAAVDECVTDCVGDLGPVSADCATCIDLHATACDTLQTDCGAVCSTQEPPQTPALFDGPRGDAP